jgi:two-component system cell cycle response regulator
MPGRAAGEAEAIAMTASVPFDLIVLNLSVTKDDPLRLASRLHATESTHDIPQLLIAEQGQRDLVLRGFDLGVNDWLLSPIDENELRARARNLIRRKFYQDRMRADLGHALEMALTDPLTGFYNQRYLMRHLGGLIAAGLPDGIAVMMVDVDHFKVINDRWGHAVGDRALKTVADTLRSRTRVFDSIARYGGEEFVVVMPGASPHAAKVAADRLRATVEELEFQPEPGVRHRLTVSIGIGSSSSAAITAEEILHTADTAMYVAKRTGRNRVVLGPLLG